MLSQATDGMVWRLGADASTTLTTSGDLDFAGTRIAAGSYSLFAKKMGDGWTLLVNSQTGQWGTEHDASKDIAEIPLMVHSGRGARTVHRRSPWTGQRRHAPLRVGRDCPHGHVQGRIGGTPEQRSFFPPVTRPDL